MGAGGQGLEYWGGGGGGGSDIIRFSVCIGNRLFSLLMTLKIIIRIFSLLLTLYVA